MKLLLNISVVTALSLTGVAAARAQAAQPPAEASASGGQDKDVGKEEKAPEVDLPFDEQMKKGGELYYTTCAMCHQNSGEGVPDLFPPLAKSDYLMADEARAIGIPMHGLTGKVTVNGKEYNSVMPALTQLSDGDIANVITFVRNSWGNSGGPTTLDEVKAVSAKPAEGAAGGHP